ncbi:kinesin-like protein [Phytophthora cinnamomi]|uniref:kinesin-like protein n=1 Tax=Phytophthora cinnamomi TaxID=4785 RepID=UPI003559D62A|nr:kinesin-like protein [Phytophthora cinnamomi]
MVGASAMMACTAAIMPGDANDSLSSPPTRPKQPFAANGRDRRTDRPSPEKKKKEKKKKEKKKEEKAATMPFPSSRIPGPGGRKAPKPSFLAPPSAGLRASESGLAAPSPARPALRTTASPVQLQRPPKRLQFPSHQSSSNQTMEEESSTAAAAAAAARAQPPVQAQVPRPVSVPQRSPVAAAAAASSFVPSTEQSDTIRVLLRIRPSPGSDSKKCLEVAPDQRGVTLAPSSQQEKRFGFDRVFTESCQQDDIFQDAGRAAVENTIEGYNGSIFAYGQTGSGKTFTMLGGTTANVHELRLSPLRGLTPRILDYLFQRLAALSRERNAAFYSGEEQERALQYTLACSYLEIYNEKIFDLLEPSGSLAAQQPKSLREDRNKEVYVDQLREIDVGSEEEALTLLLLGSQNRHISSTDMNRESSRSHAVFSVKLVLQERTSAGVKRTRRSCLHLVDLAGSEKQRQTRVAGKRLKEAAQINKSLSALGNVIMALVDVSNGQKRHVHYRDSKLTFLLRDALGGNAITSIVATISPDEKYFTETLSTLKFAQRAKFIKNNAVQNEDADSLVPVLKEQIEKLMLEIATLRSGVGVSTPVATDESTDSDPSKDEHMLRLKAIAEAEAEARAHEKKKQNRWEPALDMMQKLLRASGALSPADIAEENGEEPQQQERDAVEARCDRLEMLLYRMICRFEEYKEVTFDPERYKYSRRPHQLKPSKLQAPRMSMLPAPKRYAGAAMRYHHVDNQEHSADDDETAAALAAAEKRERELHKKAKDQQRRIDELLRRSEEAEAENDLIRHELCELLEWKAFVEEERRRVSDAVPLDVQQENEIEPQETPMLEESTVPSEEMQEIQELLNVYRSLFDDVTELMYSKKPVLCSPPSPKSGSSVVTDSNSTSYASGDEDEIGDDCMSLDGFDASEDGDGGVSDTYREIRRVNSLSSRLGRKLDLYQDAIQRLEKELQTTQDELETSSAATKFAEFQLQQLRTLAADEEAKQNQAENELRKKLDDLEQTVRFQRDEMSKVLHEKTLEDARALEHEQEVARREVEHLEHSLRSSSDSGDNDNGKEEMTSALQAAQKRIDDLEREIEASHQSVPVTLEIPKTSGDETVQLQTLLDRALEDNAKLLETVRDLQGKRQRSGANLQLLSSLLAAAAAGDQKDSDDTCADNKADELNRLRREIATLRLQRSASDFIAPGVDSDALAKPAETIQRLALERATLRTRLHRSQQTTARLEKELRRVHRNAAVDSSNGALSTEFLCGI